MIPAGHRAGDELLRQLAHLFQRHLRSRDALARAWEGMSLPSCFEHCRIENAVEIAEALRREVTEYRFSWNEKSFPGRREHHRHRCHHAGEQVDG